MRDIAIYGAGGLGKEVACLIRAINKEKSRGEEQYHLVGFFDDSRQPGTDVSVFGRVVGGMDSLNAWQSPLSVVIAVGSPSTLHSITHRITNPHVTFPNLIHPSTRFASRDTLKIGKGNIIMWNCLISCDVKIGDFNIFIGNTGIGHDDAIGNCNVIINGAVSGSVVIGDGNTIGTGSIVIQQLRIGNNVTLGAGSVLMTRPKDGCTYIGNPAKLFRY